MTGGKCVNQLAILCSLISAFLTCSLSTLYILVVSADIFADSLEPDQHFEKNQQTAKKKHEKISQGGKAQIRLDLGAACSGFIQVASMVKSVLKCLQLYAAYNTSK